MTIDAAKIERARDTAEYRAKFCRTQHQADCQLPACSLANGFLALAAERKANFGRGWKARSDEMVGWCVKETGGSRQDEFADGVRFALNGAASHARALSDESKEE